MEIEIAKVMGPAYLTVGLSLLLYGGAWQKIVAKWEKDHFAMFPLAVMQIVLGLIVIGMHNVWEANVWVLVTLSGWIMLAKGVIYFIAPGYVIKSAMKMGKNKALVYFSGLFATVMGAVLCYYSYLA